MAFDFPSSPTTGQTYSVTGGPTYVYNGTAWVVLTPGNQFNRTVFTATAGQTTFSMNYVVGAIDVYRNGVKLAPSDFTATNGTSIVLLNAATVGDTVEVISYPMITYSDAVRRTGDTMTGALEVSGANITASMPNGNMSRISLSNTNRLWSISNYGTQVSPNGQFAIADETAVAVRFAIDTAGRVSTPNQPAFHAYHGSSSTDIPVNTRIVYPSTYMNVGNHYNTSSGLFTAPVSGVYYFSASVFCRNSSSASAFDLRVNGVSRGRAQAISNGDYFPSIGIAEVFNLAANDTVEVYVSTGNVHVNGNISYFTGCLLG